jgi:transposase
VARRTGLAESKVRAIDLRYLERWEAKRRGHGCEQMAVDEIYRGKEGKFLTVVCNLETGGPLWFDRERKKETLDDFFRSQLVSRQRKRIEAVCVDMWEPFRLSIEQWAPQCKIVYDKFHIMQLANDAIDEVRKAEFFRQGKQKRGLIKGKKWLLLSRWQNLTDIQRGELNRLFQINRRVFKAYMLKESLERLWNYRYRGAMLNYLNHWMDQLKWQRLAPFEKLAKTLLKHVDGIANYCETKSRFGVVEAVNGNIRMLINRGRGYQNLRYSATEGPAHRSDERRIHRSSQHDESRVKWHLLTNSRSEHKNEGPRAIRTPIMLPFQSPASPSTHRASAG